MADQRAPSPAEIAIMGGGAVAFVGSLLKYVEGASAWNGFFFPTVTLVGIFGLVMAAQVALTKYANVNMGNGIAGLSWKQVHLLLGFYAAVFTVAELINATSGRKIGFWLMLIGGVAAFVGAWMLSEDRSTSPGPSI